MILINIEINQYIAQNISMRSIFLSFLLVYSLAALSQEHYLFIGTYTGKGSKGIYVYKFNATTGEAKWVSNTDSATTQNPAFLTIAPNGKFLYAVYEEGGQKNGQVNAYAFDRKKGNLSLINQQSSGGDHPCHVNISKDGKWVTAANYTGGSLAILPVNADGSLQPAAQVIQHSGSSTNKSRQEKPHVHQTVFTPQNDYLFSPDLGIDKVIIYKLNLASKKPIQSFSDAKFAASEPGSGPRHITFHPNNKYVYLVEELSGTVCAFHYEKGKLKLQQRIITHPKEFKGTIGSADIHVSPDGKFLYASNRGTENTITIFSIAPATGKLSLVGYEATKGDAPRNFMIDPTGNYLLVANQNTNNIVIFKRNITTGKLTDTGKQIQVPNPVCLQLLK
jgi:6-phosphogluconolactonase